MSGITEPGTFKLAYTKLFFKSLHPWFIKNEKGLKCGSLIVKMGFHKLPIANSN